MTTLLIFAGIILLSFVTMLLLMRPTVSQKVAKQRLIEISHTQAKISGQDSAGGLVAIGSQGETGTLEQIFRRYRFSYHLSTLIMHAGKTSSVTSVMGMSVGLAVLGGILAHAFISALPLEVAAVLLGGALPYAKLRFHRSRRL